MADAFEKFMSSVNRGVTTLSVKTSSSIEKSKIKTHIESIRKDVERSYLAAGEIGYKIWLSGSGDYSVLAEQYMAVQSKLNEIAELTRQYDSIAERDNQILGNNNEIQLEVPGVPKAICPKCGSQFATEVKFCRQCGTKIGE